MSVLKYYFLFLLFICFNYCRAENPRYKVTGVVTDHLNSEPLPYCLVKLPDYNQWSVTNENGVFEITNVISGKTKLEVSIMGFEPKIMDITVTGNLYVGKIELNELDLGLPGIEVTARRKSQSETTSYVIDRNVLDHAQLIELSGITSLLPGGQTVNATLMDDSRLALRAGDNESGNASFSTAVEIDGVRLDNNANMEETLSASTRNISTANIGSVEVITGIPSVEYGDLGNGIVKVTPRRGNSPWIIEASINPYSRQFAIIKGLSLPDNGGIFNFSVEHARSFSNISSPYTSYRRNNFSVSYIHHFLLSSSTLTLNAGFSGNLGGYKSDSDPDTFKDTYTHVRDNRYQANIRLDWLKSSYHGVFRLSFQGAAVYSDKMSETNSNVSSSSTQAYLHTMSEGYEIAKPIGESGEVPEIVLGPTGYWYVRQYNDQKPLSLQAKIKSSWTRESNTTGSADRGVNTLSAGIDFQSSSNLGKGIYYEDMAVAPTWRPYPYNVLPTLNTIAIFIENKLAYHRFNLTAGLRQDITYINGSEYGIISKTSPRINLSFDILQAEKIQFSIFGGYGQGAKLPSFQILYPADTYSDKLIFTPGSTSDNKAFYGYYTHVSKTDVNKELKLQTSHQGDFGLAAKIGLLDLSVSAYFNHTLNSYQAVNIYSPFSYIYTSQAALENCGIPSEQRDYAIDAVSGLVTVRDKSTGHIVNLEGVERHTYVSNRKYINGSPVTRYGVEWIAELPLISLNRPVNLSLRLDGNYYHYKGLSQTMIAGSPNGIGDYAAHSGQSPLIGYYSGSNVTSITSSAPSVSHGFVSGGCSLNTTLTMRIPKIKLIVTLRLESTFYNYKRYMADSRNTVLLATAGDVFGIPYNGEKDNYVSLYPEYYSTWENPTQLIPFAEALVEAYHNHTPLYQQLCNLIVRSNTSYYFNPQSTSPYFSANFSITKEIGKWVSLSIYANNFFNNMSFVRNSQTGLVSSLFASSYIPKFYYGVALRIKI